MRDQRHQRAVAGQDGRRHEREARVLHAAVGEAGRQHQHVVAAPAVGTVEPLGRRHHLLDLGELPRRPVDDRRLGVHAGAAADRPELQVADGQRDQVRRHRLRHLEPVAAVARALHRVGGAHHGQQVRWDLQRGVVGHPDRGAVLAGDPGASQDRLGLAEQERLARRRLRGLEPLQRPRSAAGRVVDHDAVGRAHADGQRLPEHRVVLPELVRQVGPVLRRHVVDLELPGVEHQGVGVRRPAVEVQRGAAAEPTLVEVDRQVQAQVPYGDLVRTRAGVRVHGANVTGASRWLRCQGAVRPRTVARSGRAGNRCSLTEKGRLTARSRP